MAAQPDAASGSGGHGQACADLGGADLGGADLGGADRGGAGAAQRYAWLENLLPPAEEVRPGLWSIPVPWPDSSLRYTLAAGQLAVRGREWIATLDISPLIYGPDGFGAVDALLLLREPRG